MGGLRLCALDGGQHGRREEGLDNDGGHHRGPGGEDQGPPGQQEAHGWATLAKTIERFNGFSKNGKDEDFSRGARTLGPVDKPPFYALPLYAGGPNTKGGIAANAKREALDWSLKPIPRLYTAGEVSSALKFVYQGGGNLTECLVFGRTAGGETRQPTNLGNKRNIRRIEEGYRDAKCAETTKTRT